MAGSALPSQEQGDVTSPNRFSQTTDQDLVALSRKGRDEAEEACGELMRRYRSEVLAFIGQIVRDPDLAEDLTQDTFLKVLNELESHGPERDVEGWIFTIANHLAVDYLRDSPLDTVSLDTTADTVRSGGLKAAAYLTNPTPSPTPDSDIRRVASEIERAIAKLRGLQRRCMKLRYLEARSYDDIASMLGLPVGTVSSHISRARQQVRKTLGYLPDAMS